MITEEKEDIFNDWVSDHRTFIWAELKADMSDALSERQLRYLVNKRIDTGYITKSGDEYTVVGKIEQLKREMEMEEEKPVILPEPKTEPVKEEIVTEVKEEKKEVPKIKEPDIIKEKVKNIEKMQTRKRIEISKEPKIVIKKQEPKSEKGLIAKYWYLIAIPIVGLLAYLVYKLLTKSTTPVETPVEPAKSELERMGFTDASKFFEARP